MPRTGMSSGAIEAATQLISDVLLLTILDIEHTSSGTHIRLVNNNEDISYDSNTYTAVGFDFSFPDEKEDGFGQARLVINNADLWLTPTIRSLSGEFKVTPRVVSATDLTADPPEFNTVEREDMPIIITDLKYDGKQVSIQMSYEHHSTYQYPCDMFSPTNFPGLF